MNPRDSGLQPERTALSWRRTGWSMLIPALLCLRGWSYYGDVFYALSGGILLAGSLAMFCDIPQRKHYLIALIVIVSAMILMVAMVRKY